MKNKKLISLLVLSAATLTACGGSGTSSSSSTGSESNEGGSSIIVPTGDGKIQIDDYGTLKYEAENLVVKDWVSDASYNGNIIISDAKASGGAYLAGGARNSSGKVTFEFTLEKYSKVVFSAAYAQTESSLQELIQMNKTYFYNIENINPFTNGTDNVLAKRDSVNDFQLIEYEPQTLAAGTYSVTLTVCADTPKACPAIDYIQFVTTDPNADVKPDTSTITEDDIPNNVMFNLQQYKYIVDGDWKTYRTYADGRDLSAPRGLKLEFDDVDDSDKYYIQVAENEDELDDAKIRETTEKCYYFQNAKLSTTYYYRAATDEADLEDADVQFITCASTTPRVIGVPTVLNFRDIGGWETSLVPGAKINQGLYYRCAQFQGSGSPSKIDSTSLPLIEELGITRDIDMRDSYNVPSTSPISTTDWPVEIVKASIASGTEATRWEAFGDVYKLIFETIADADNNPVALHCTYGADRTGIATFFLEALLGMSLDDMRMDYVWTKFTKDRDPNPDGELAKWIQKTDETYPEEDCFANKMRAHLMTKGIEKSTLEHIREIFIPGYVAEE